MKKTTVELVIKLTPELKATCLIKLDLQPAEIGDAVTASVELQLPVKGFKELDPEIRFGNRVAVFDEFLYCSWGDYSNPNVRCSSVNLDGSYKTYLEALEDAKKYVDEELKGLHSAIAARALARAGALKGWVGL